MQNRLALAGAVLCLAAITAPAHAVLLGTCTLTIGSNGQMQVSPQLNALDSTLAGGSAATLTVKTAADLCIISTLLDCFGVVALAPLAFTSEPSGGSGVVTFASSYRLNGGAQTSGIIRTAIRNGTFPMTVNLRADKASGVFAAGTYQAQVTVRCE